LERQPRPETRDGENAFRNIAHFYGIVVVVVVVMVVVSLSSVLINVF